MRQYTKTSNSRLLKGHFPEFKNILVVEENYQKLYLRRTPLDWNGPERRGPRKLTLTFLLPSDLYQCIPLAEFNEKPRTREPIDAVQEGQHVSHRVWERAWRIDMGVGDRSYML